MGARAKSATPIVKEKPSTEEVRGKPNFQLTIAPHFFDRAREAMLAFWAAQVRKPSRERSRSGQTPRERLDMAKKYHLISSVT